MKLTRKQQILVDGWMATDNPRPAFLDEKDEQLLQLNLRRHLKRKRRGLERTSFVGPLLPPPAVERKPREFTRKRPGSRRFKRLTNPEGDHDHKGILDIIHAVQGSTARSLPTLTPRE